MNNIIERIYQRTTEYSHPSQATTTANALDLLSSGIYTEEERFIFELLQNAVDSFDMHKQTVLEIRIVLTDNLLVFMHNGSPFSERDLEGLCDIGNGNKIMDAKKIGYKGIGFKSVFMHSHRVTVWTAGTCFKFDKEACEAFAKSKGSGYEDVKMPWQIIPILTKTPSGINTEGFNVVTYIEISNKKSLKRKVEKLLSDTRFLLFLKVDDLRVSFWEDGVEILNLSKKQTADELTLSVNGKPQSSWLIYSTGVKLTPAVKDALMHDSKTPTKLKDSDSVEISFAIALDKDKNIIPLSDAVMYTYLPTSFSFGLNFIVNANFITDAGRQQIVKDCAWNEFIFAQIPKSYLDWMKNLAKKYSDWYKVLPPYPKSDDELSEAYSTALKDALNTIPFIKAVNGDMVLLQEALTDHIGLHPAIPPKIFESFVHTNILKNTNFFSLVSSEVGQALQKMYGVANVTIEQVHIILEKSNEYLKDLTDEETLTFLMWLRGLSQDLNNDFKRSVSYANILFDKDSNLIAPVESFFPSEYSDENPDISADAKIIRQSLADKFSNELIDWLKELGVQEMSNLSVIEKVLCKKDYITKENCIKVMQFIFDSEQKEHVLDKLGRKIHMLRLLTKSGELETADNMFMDSSYGIRINGDNSILDEYFVSAEYIRKRDNIMKWQLFFREIGVNTEFYVRKRIFGSKSLLYKSFSSLVDYCTKNEKKYGQWPIHTSGLFVHIYIQAQLPPILNFSSDGFSKCKFVWSNAMEHPVNLDSGEDYIAGHTGWNYYAHGYFKDNRDGHKYLGELVLPYLLKTRNLLPGTDKQLHRSVELLAPTEENYQLYGHYLPTLDIETQIDNSWFNILDFKTKLTLSDYLSVLSQISQDKENMTINKNRVNSIYERIADSFDFSEGSSDFILVQSWGKSHRILSKEGQFELPNSLYLLSSNLSGVELDNQAYHAKYLENDRFASFMIALGVNMITDYHVEGIEDGTYISDINNMFVQKEDFLTSVAVGDSFTEDTWEEAKAKMHNAIMRMEFYQADSISIYYGNQGFPKMVYSKANEFYFVGNFGLANQELLHDDIMAALGLPKKVSTIFLAILQMDDFLELKEYIKQKGYDTSFIEEHNDLIRDKNQPAAIMSGENAAYGGLTKEEMRNALEEAKEAVLDKLSKDGFDISNKEWDGWTCIDGVRKDGREYPLVIRSNKSQRNTCLSPKDWNQLMKPNAMFAVVASTGIGTISLREILKSKELISIRFSSENIDNPQHISELATVFAYFKGIQFDFESYIHPVVSQWERFMSPEQETGELPIAVSPSALPE